MCMGHMWKLENNSGVGSLLLPCRPFRGTQVIWLVVKCFYLLNHLTGPLFQFLTLSSLSFQSLLIYFMCLSVEFQTLLVILHWLQTQSRFFCLRVKTFPVWLQFSPNLTFFCFSSALHIYLFTFIFFSCVCVECMCVYSMFEYVCLHT